MLTFILLCWLLGFFFFWKIPFPKKRESLGIDPSKVSIIIPARNEEGNLKRLLTFLRDQSVKSCEIIVVDDHSEDQTAQVGREAGVRVIPSAPLPEGWVGKTWACWQGANQSRGDLFIVLDADTFLEPEGLSKILSTYGEEEGALSVQPFHKMNQLYERLSAYFNIISMAGVNAFTPLGSRINPAGAYGQCFMCKRKDYFDLGGHQIVRGEILEHLALGKEFIRSKSKSPMLRREGKPLRAHVSKWPGIPDQRIHEKLSDWAPCDFAPQSFDDCLLDYRRSFFDTPSDSVGSLGRRYGSLEMGLLGFVICLPDVLDAKDLPFSSPKSLPGWVKVADVHEMLVPPRAL